LKVKNGVEEQTESFIGPSLEQTEEDRLMNAIFEVPTAVS
jgi:hypothetical protein